MLALGHFSVLHVVGARPNFMKVAPVMRALDARKGFRSILVHTGQHYDAQMSASFFDDLQIPAPDRQGGFRGTCASSWSAPDKVRAFHPPAFPRSPPP